jgi:GxxExxY protein
MKNEMWYNSITKKIINCAISVHKELGAGLMESVYSVCLKSEMQNQGLTVRTNVTLPVIFKLQELDKIFIIDMLVQDEIILELKSVEGILPIHEAQLVTYLKL